MMRERAACANPAATLSIFDSTLSVPPEPEVEMPDAETNSTSAPHIACRNLDLQGHRAPSNSAATSAL
jgi:hypothetical protein